MERRDFPIIKLAPWEHLSNALAQEIESRAQNVAPFQWRNRKMQLAARFADCGDGAHFLFLRDVLSNEEGHWILGVGCHDDGPQRFYGSERLKLPARLAVASKTPYFPFGRLFHFAGKELCSQKLWRCFVAGNGSGCWLPAHAVPHLVNEDENSFHLSLLPSESLLDWSAREVRTLLLQQANDERYDAHFALAWAHLTQFEQEDHALCVEQGSVAQLRALLECVFKIQPELQERDALWNWDVEPNEQPWSGLNFTQALDEMPGWAPIPLRLRVWKRELLAYFRPHFDLDLRRRHACVRKSTGNYEFLLRVETQTPTQHERIEAALALRDWAHDKIASAKLKLLLSGTK